MTPTPNLDVQELDQAETPAPSPFDTRIPFALAISDKKTLGGAWKQLSTAQKVALKVFYGLPLETEEELKLWAAYQGFGIYDELGYLTGVTYIPPYVPKEYDTLNGLIGRRSGKSDRIGGLAAAYEITLGGHTAHIKKGQPAYWLYIAQDLDTAKLNLKFVTSWIKESPTLSKMIVKETEDEVHFSNGIILKAEPPNIRTGRGAAVIGITMDEMAFWYKDAKSANPDFEVIRALEYATAQFPDSKQLRITTPWTKEGVAYLAWKRGTEGSKVSCSNCVQNPHFCTHAAEEREEDEGSLVLHAPTAMMGNPRMTRKRLLRLWKRDKEAFKRESLAQFIDTQSSFLTHASIEAAISRGIGELQPVKGVDYVAAIDPAFRHDSFAFTIGHNDKTLGIVQDYVFEWTPEPGERLHPREVLQAIKNILTKWGIDLLYSDQYQYEALAALAEELDLVIIGVDLTQRSKPKMMQNLASLLNQRRLRLLDFPNQEKQLKRLQKTVGPSGYVNIAAPGREHDDMAMVLSLMLSKAIELPPYEAPVAVKEGRPKFISDKDLEKLRQRWNSQANYDEVVAEQNRRWALLQAYE